MYRRLGEILGVMMKEKYENSKKKGKNNLRCDLGTHF
jgi:hypothetical protein